jgi:subtilisin family serine protease
MKKHAQSFFRTPVGFRGKNLFSWFALSFVLVFASSCEMGLDKNSPSIDASARAGSIGINVVLNTNITDALVAKLNQYGNVQDVIPAIKALTMRIPSDQLTTIQQLSFVAAANPDRERNGSPVDAVPIADFSGGLSTWNLDAINVTDLNAGRIVAQDGSGVYVGILDTGLLDSWRQYFPEERIAEEYAAAFGGGGGENGNVSEQPNKWEHDQNSHGTHVASTILGFKLGSAYFNGVAPKATIIPVKVLNQTGRGWGWSSVIARGIVYLTDLKRGPLSNSPVVINMSLGGSELDALEKAAVDYAVANGVIIVASAGNEGEEGMGYPGAYAPVISAASAGWKDQWSSSAWWYAGNVPDPTNVNDLYISDFSSRAHTGQDLDVVAPGSYIVGPYQTNSGQLSYYFLSGTSMASPHVAGIVALLAQVRNNLTASQAENVLEAAAATLPIGAGSRNVRQADGSFQTVSWGANATGNGFITANAALAALALNP